MSDIGPATRFKRSSPVALALAGLAAGAIVFTPSAQAGAATARCENVRVSPAEDTQLATQAILCLLNHERAGRHLRRLRISTNLTRAASGHSKDMVKRRYFAHTTPANVTFDHRIRRARYAPDGSAKLGENLAWGMGDPALPIEIVRGWMASPEHRANILEPAYRSIGIGISAGVPVDATASSAASGATYTTDFGSR